MKFKLGFICLGILFITSNLHAQVKIGDNHLIVNENSLLELESTNKGFVFPRVSLTDVSLPYPMTNTMLPGTIVYNTNLLTIGGSGLGLYLWNGSEWDIVKLSSAALDSWGITGNSLTNSNSNFIGSLDDMGLAFRTNNIEAMHIDSLQNVGIGIIPSDENRFEVKGKFRLHEGNFNMRYNPDIVPFFVPGIKYIGSEYNNSDTEHIFNGVINLPPGLGNDTLFSITGYVNLVSQRQNLINAGQSGINLNSNSNNTNAGINIDDSSRLNMYSSTNGGSDNANINMDSSHLNFNLYKNLGGGENISSNININQGSLFLNTGQWNGISGKNSSINLDLNNINLGMNMPDTSNNIQITPMGISLNHFNNSNGNGNFNIYDTTWNLNSNTSGNTRNTNMSVNPSSFNINTYDNATNNSSNFGSNTDNYGINFNDNVTQWSSFYNLNATRLDYSNRNFPNTINSYFKIDSTINFSHNGLIQSYGIKADDFNSSIYYNDYFGGGNSSLNLSKTNFDLNLSNPINNAQFSMSDQKASFSSNNDFRLGIQNTNPQANLDVNGSYKLGNQGTVNKNVVSFTYSLPGTDVVPAATLDVSGGGSYSTGALDLVISIPPSNNLLTQQGTVHVSPSNDLPTDVSIASARILSTSEVVIRLQNHGTASSQTISGSLYITITEF